MSLPKNFEAEYRRVLAEKAGAALVEVLRLQLPSLTFAELHVVLGSPHGKVIAGMPVAVLLRGAAAVVVSPAETPVAASAVAAKSGKTARKSTKQPKKATKATKATKRTKQNAATKATKRTKQNAAAKPASEEKAAAASEAAAVKSAAAIPASGGKGKKSAKKGAKKGAKKKAAKKSAKKDARAESAKRQGPKGLAAEAAIVETLRAHGGPMASRELRAVLKGIATNTLLRALQRLVEAGTVQRLGESRSSPYSLVGGAPAVSVKAAGASEVAPASEGAAASATKGTTKKGSKKKSAKARAKAGGGEAKGGKGSVGSATKASAGDVSSRTIEGRKAYDTAILNALRSAGDWAKLSDVQQVVGGTEEQVRIGLRRLADGGLVQRTGERQTTRYKLAG